MIALGTRIVISGVGNSVCRLSLMWLVSLQNSDIMTLTCGVRLKYSRRSLPPPISFSSFALPRSADRFDLPGHFQKIF